MKKIFYTQRVENIEDYNERRDCADQRIPELLKICGYLPFPMPNIPDCIEMYFQYNKPDGIILTGGNSIVKYGGNAPERDLVDQIVLENAIKYNIPVYGFCRGMQSILDYFGVELVQIKDHVAVRHKVSGSWGEQIVNSYHNQAAISVNEAFIVTGMSADHVIESIVHREYKICGTMWHPERERPFQEIDIVRIQKFFG